MKKIYIVRHAKSSWSDSTLHDFDRPLNDRGKKDAPLMGKVLKKLKIWPDLIISSPAKRALTTAKLMTDEMGYTHKKILTDKDIYNAGPAEMIQLISGVNNDVNSLMLFGHNPTFTMIVNIITDFDLGNLPTCAFVEIELLVDNWKAVSAGTGRVIRYEYPKKHK